MLAMKLTTKNSRIEVVQKVLRLSNRIEAYSDHYWLFYFLFTFPFFKLLNNK